MDVDLRVFVAAAMVLMLMLVPSPDLLHPVKVAMALAWPAAVRDLQGRL